jgi:hypothetical protein
VAQAVSRWLPIAAARVRARVWSCGICGGQSGAVEGFLRVLRFPLANFILSTCPQSPSSIIWGWYSKPVMAAVPSGLSLIPLRIIKQIQHINEISLLCTIYKSSVNPGFAKQIMSIARILCYNGNLFAWTVVSLTTAKFKPLTFCVPGFTLSYTTNMFILMILYYFCLSPALFSVALPVHSGPRPLIQFRNRFSQMVGFLGRAH